MSLRISLRVGVLSMAAACVPAGAATLTSYNLVVTGNYSTNSHVDGRSFVNNISVQNSPVFAMHSSAGTGDTLTIAGSVTGNALHVNRGVLRTKTALPNGFTVNLNGGASRVVDPTVSIADLASQITAASAHFASVTESTAGYGAGNIVIDQEGKRINFNASAAAAGKAAIFTLAASELSRNNLSFAFNLGSATSAIINVVGGASLNPNQGNFNGASGALASKVLWNFASATSLSLKSNWYGTILGPNLSVNMNNQNIDGGVYVRNLTQTGELHDFRFVGPQPISAAPLVIPLPSAALAGLLGLAALGGRRKR